MGRKDDEDKLNADKLLSGSSDTLTKSKDVPAPQAQLGKGRSFLAILLWTFLIISLAYASALYYFKFPLPTDATQARAQIGELQIIISEHLPNFQAASASAQTSGHTPKSSTERAKKSDENFVDAKVDEDITGAQFTHEDLFLDMDRDGSGGLDEDEVKFFAHSLSSLSQYENFATRFEKKTLQPVF